MATDIFLTFTALKTLFQNLAVTMTGLAADMVRLSWPTGGAPAWGITDNICFLKVMEIDNPYNRQRDVSFSEIDPNNANQAMSYTRVIAVNLIFYGPNSFDNAQAVRDQIFYPANHDTLALNNIYLVPDVESPRYAPELFAGQWWERTDMTLYFNEQVTRNTTVPFIQTAEIILQDGGTGQTRIDADVTVGGNAVLLNGQSTSIGGGAVSYQGT